MVIFSVNPSVCSHSYSKKARKKSVVFFLFDNYYIQKGKIYNVKVLPTVALAIPTVIQFMFGGDCVLFIKPNIFVNDSLIICRDATDIITAKMTIESGSSFVLPAIR
jgi:hypothetical protein